MILSQLFETITKISSKESLQKLLDIHNLDTRFRVVDEKTIEYIEAINNVTLKNIKTAGKLPFSIITNDRLVGLLLDIPTLTTLKGLIKENELIKLTVQGSQTNLVNLSLVGMPKVEDLIITYSGIKSFLGSQVSKTAIINFAPNITSLKGLDCLRVQLSNCNKFTFKNFPNSITHINLEYNKISKGFMYYAQVPSNCVVVLHGSNHDLIHLLEPIRQNNEWNAGKKLLMAQNVLIDNDYSDEEIDA